MNRLNTQGRRVGRLYGFLLMMSYLGCIVVDANFAPANKATLKTAVDACLKKQPDGSDVDCNGSPIGDWDVSKVTDFSQCTCKVVILSFCLIVSTFFFTHTLTRLNASFGLLCNLSSLFFVSSFFQFCNDACLNAHPIVALSRCAS